MNCWTCREPVQGPVCPSCGALQPPPPPEFDHFAFLGLPRRHGLAKKDIESAWRALSRKVHPDRFTGRKAVERRMALQWTARAHEARAVLKDPHRRALYLATGAAELPEKGGPDVGADFLEQVFELQMAARTGEADVAERVSSATAELEDALEAVLLAHDNDNGPLDDVPVFIARLRYLRTARALTES